jgi:integrase
VLSYTGLRRGDAVRLGKQHVREGEAVITTEKSGGKVEVIIPLHLFPALIETLRVGPTSDLHFICGANGKPMTKESFGNMFRDACRAAGIKRSAHGLRKLAGRCRRRHLATQCDVRLDRNEDGVTLYASVRAQAGGQGGVQEAGGERNCNIYSRTFGFKRPHLEKINAKSNR